MPTTKKQTTRMKKLACAHCGWSFRTTRLHISAMQHTTCLACGTAEALQTQ